MLVLGTGILVDGSSLAMIPLFGVALDSHIIFDSVRYVNMLVARRSTREESAGGMS